MNKDQSYGGLILIISLIVFVFYLVGLFIPAWTFYLIEIPVVLAVLAILGITMWIGWTMLTTPPPAPLEADLAGSTSTTATSGTSAASKTDDKT